MLWICMFSGKCEVYIVLCNCVYSNVVFMFGELLCYQLGLDILMIYLGVLFSYLNFMFDLLVMDVEVFVGVLEVVKSGEDFDKVVECWGVCCSNLQFWSYFYDFEVYICEIELVEVGVLDMNCYENF